MDNKQLKEVLMQIMSLVSSVWEELHQREKDREVLKGQFTIIHNKNNDINNVK